MWGYKISLVENYHFATSLYDSFLVIDDICD
jgi:hypothetical protein